MKRTAATGTLLVLALATAPASPAAAAVIDGQLATASSPRGGGERVALPRAEVKTAQLYLRADATPAPVTLAGAATAPAASFTSSVADVQSAASDQDAAAPRARGPPPLS